MKFLHDNFFLTNETSRQLYHDVAAKMPIYDYHCHLVPADIATNRSYQNLHEIWLEDDHYKWRAMRANGIDEQLITGDADPYDKFSAWARTVPKTLRNPLYHWTHLELRRYFDIELLLDENTAREVWDETERQLKTLDTHAILKRFDVALVGTTDDPADDLEHHAEIAKLDFNTRVYPAFRPDGIFRSESPITWNNYFERLCHTAGVSGNDLESLLDALARRHNVFHEAGSRLSDHSFTHLPDFDCTEEQAKAAFNRVRSGEGLCGQEIDRFSIYLLRYICRLDAEKNWSKQLHLGAARNLNFRLFQSLGRDVGGDSIGDYRQGPGLHRLLAFLDREGHLPKMILYNINPSDNYLFATTIGNYQQGPTAGKLQFGSGWWYLDQPDGMRWQLDALSNNGLLAHFVGMLTDSRSMMSYPRHEYFRRLLCELIGSDAKRGELPDDFKLLSQLVSDICFHNAQRYFQMGLSPFYDEYR